MLLADDTLAQEKLLSLYQFPQDSLLQPERLKVLIYDYYLHAYPEEQEDIDVISVWLSKNYELVESQRSGNITVSEWKLDVGK